MSFSKHTITFTNTSATTESSGINSEGFDGEIYAVKYPYIATIESTNTLSLFAGGTDRVILSGIALSTNPWTLYPRAGAANSTGATTSWGTSTDTVQEPVAHVKMSTEYITGILVGDSAAATVASVELLVRGH